MEENKDIQLEKNDDIKNIEEDNSKRNMAKSLAFLSLLFCAIAFVISFFLFGDAYFSVWSFLIPLIIGLIFSIMSIITDPHNFWGILFTLLYILGIVLILFAVFAISSFGDFISSID